MKPWTAVGAWAALLALWALVQLLFAPQAIGVILLGGAALAVAALAAVVVRSDRPRAPKDEDGPVISPATVLVALGVAALLSGTELGPWCLALGALMTAGGVAGLLNEVRR